MQSMLHPNLVYKKINIKSNFITNPVFLLFVVSVLKHLVPESVGEFSLQKAIHFLAC